VFYTLRNVAVAIITIDMLVFPVATRFLPIQTLAYFVIVFVVIHLTAGALFIIALLKTSRTFGLLALVAIASAVIATIAAISLHLWGRQNEFVLCCDS
jgi:hypothetical protein